jgi:hypothetical protein
MEKRNSLTPSEYWEWRTTISELEASRAKLKSCELELKLLEKDVELLATKAQLFKKTRLSSSQFLVENCNTEYEKFKKNLEDKLGVSLSGKIIDDISFEIKELLEESKNP